MAEPNAGFFGSTGSQPEWMNDPRIVASGIVFAPGTTYEQALATIGGTGLGGPNNTYRKTPAELEAERIRNEAYGVVNAGNPTSVAGWNVAKYPPNATRAQIKAEDDRIAKLMKEGQARRTEFERNFVPPRTIDDGEIFRETPGFMDVPSGAVAGPAGQPQRGGAFLPPYLQPGGSTQIQPQSMLDRNAPSGSWDTINNGVPNIPGVGGVGASPFGRAGATPTLTGVPGSLTPRTGASGTVAGILNQYNTGGRGGFSATAKMLELPYYLRNMGRTYGR